MGAAVKRRWYTPDSPASLSAAPGRPAIWDHLRMSSARDTALRALWGTDEFLDSAGYSEMKEIAQEPRIRSLERTAQRREQRSITRQLSCWFLAAASKISRQ